MFYINLGRWADNVIGPFETTDDAECYCSLQWANAVHDDNTRALQTWSHAKVVGVAPPKPRTVSIDFDVPEHLVNDICAYVDKLVREVQS